MFSFLYFKNPNLKEAAMPAPRNISTDKREKMIDQVNARLLSQGTALDDIIADLSKPHVDNKARAKTLLATAKKLRKGLPA